MSIEDDDELPAWSLRRDDPRARGLKPALPHAIDRAWLFGDSDGAGVRVAIVDSGVDGSHEFVGGVQRAVVAQVNDAGELEVVDDTTGDVSGHGTACAGLVRAIAPGAEIWSVRVLGTNSKGGARALIGGLQWAVDQGCEVINMSLSTPKRETAEHLHDIADKAFFAGSAIVASAHNLDVRSYPWRFASVISVASHDGEDPLEFLYNPQPPVEFLARGLDVEIAWLGGAKIIAAGNSFATAQMSGICARVLAAHPGMSPFELKTVLRASATNLEAV